MKRIVPLLLLIILCLASTSVFAHCQIPCGIYGDKIQFALMKQHIITIEKSMNMITKISSADKKNYNQLVRWVNNKEEHAKKLSKILTYYFLAQRVKLSKEQDALYLQKLVVLHQLLVYSMRAKQTSNVGLVVKLKELLAKFEKLYFGKAKACHKH